jgi:hypothetical protein
MTTGRVVDAHAHILSEATMALMRKEAPQIGPRLERIDDDFAVLTVAGSPYRPFPRGGWDMAKRFGDMDAAGIDVQVVSNTPQTFLYNQEAALTAALAALQNDQIAAAVAAHPDRLIGIATLPMQAPQLAADELRRAMRKLGLKVEPVGDNLCAQTTIDAGGEAMNGARCHVPMTALSPVPSMLEMGKRFQDRFGRVPDHNGFKGYIGAHLARASAHALVRELAGRVELYAASTRGMAPAFEALLPAATFPVLSSSGMTFSM